MTFDTAFKHLYAKELAPYGFQKIKGRRPYFVRMVGDEIAHVISYRNSWSMRPYKNFIVLWGIATVYRRRINFEKKFRGIRLVGHVMYAVHRANQYLNTGMKA